MRCRSVGAASGACAATGAAATANGTVIASRTASFRKIFSPVSFVSLGGGFALQPVDCRCQQSEDARLVAAAPRLRRCAASPKSAG
jgi:hypothetical protein